MNNLLPLLFTRRCRISSLNQIKCDEKAKKDGSVFESRDQQLVHRFSIHALDFFLVINCGLHYRELASVHLDENI